MDDLEPPQRIVPEPLGPDGNPIGWRAKDLGNEDLSGDDYADQFTRHEPEG